MTDHPITPPRELVQQWVSLACEYEGNETWIDLATEAARWGADQELEECCEWIYKLMDRGLEWSMDLRAARRPKPPSLAEQALDAIDEEREDITLVNYKVIRAALERLQELENND